MVCGCGCMGPSQDKKTALHGCPFPAHMPGSPLPVHVVKTFLGHSLLEKFSRRQSRNEYQGYMTRTQERPANGVFSD